MTTQQGQDAITPSILARTQELAWGVELLTGSIGSAAAAGYLIGWLVQGGTPR
ncbi:MAG: hypothetical protein H7323_05865 [Frankiales bacterium]|nr:hypothetical protein [Frankiales bacterium]